MCDQKFSWPEKWGSKGASMTVSGGRRASLATLQALSPVLAVKLVALPSVETARPLSRSVPERM